LTPLRPLQTPTCFVSQRNDYDRTRNRRTESRMLRVFLVVASVLSCSALVMPLHTPRPVASFSSARTSPANMGFEDSLAAMIDGVSAFFAKGGPKKAPVRGPSHNECRLQQRTSPPPSALSP
jgi:hypothetical protein